LWYLDLEMNFSFVFFISVFVDAGPRCTGNPKMYNGKMCASTTRYNDYHKGACGCGPASGDSQFGWNHDHFVTAPNQYFFDEHDKHWCGNNCGRCVKLTTTGGYVDGQGGPTGGGQSHVFMVTNLCPNEYPNQHWCNQDRNRNNDYGYKMHFDLENGAGQIGRLGWNNPEVTVEIVNCYGVFVDAGPRCTGNPKMYNGKMCASTTRYADYHKGACGCGDAHGDSQFGWNHDHFVTAPNQYFFDRYNKGWCGESCGKCVKLTTTGGYVDGQGGPTGAGQSHVFMVTNLCPNVYPNQHWCNQDAHRNNDYGYKMHFDLENGAGQIARLGWNNPEVTVEIVGCGGYNTPNSGMYQQCQCAHQGKRSLNNTTFN
ncbi:hypothetical protein FSP39_009283, partial [Pinctada imbricata]